MKTPRLSTLCAMGAVCVLAGCASVGKTIHSTTEVYPPVGPYSQMVQTGNLYFLAGVVALNKAGTAIQGATIEEQTKLVLDYIGTKLKSQGMTHDNVVMSTVYLKNLNDFAAMNRVYAEVFKTAPPSRATVEVARLPRDALIEIAVIAAK